MLCYISSYVFKSRCNTQVLLHFKLCWLKERKDAEIIYVLWYCRDPRWGRGQETPGEGRFFLVWMALLLGTCRKTWLWQTMSLPVPLLLNSLLFLLATFPSSKDPYLTSQYAIQFVKGMQFGNDLRYALHYAWLASTRGPNTHLHTKYWFVLHEFWLGLG